jgi:exonuclease VII large subunit
VIVTRYFECLQGEHWRFSQGVRWWLNTLADAAALRSAQEAAAGQLPSSAAAAASYDTARVQQQLQQAAQQMDGYMDMGIEQRQQLLQQLQAQLLPQVRD